MKKIKIEKYNIISLGYNCYPRTLLTRHGIKKPKSEGELTMPFDLAAFATKEITALLRYDFKYFFDDLEYSKNDNFWVKMPDKIQFMHDKIFNQDNKFQLIEKYNQRIKNFYKTVKNPDPVMFVQLIGDDEDVTNVFNQLRRLRQQTPFVFCIIDPNKLTSNLDSRIQVFHTKAPEGYFDNWWKHSCYSKQSSQEYEEKIIDFCIDSLNNHLST